MSADSVMSGASNSGAKLSYENKEHERGSVKASVPAGFTDLSTIHKPLGCLRTEVSRVAQELALLYQVHEVRILVSFLLRCILALLFSV